MPLLKSQIALTAEERTQKRKILIRDSIALFTLLLITVALFTGTIFLFRSFTELRARLAKRWLDRGEAALHSGHPELAVEDLRSALAYSPGQRSIEIELAEALAGAGRIQEANSYFNTLVEAEPGNGIINLQLARLAARQGNQSEALDRYRISIYGNWEGDGSVRRRDVRLELIYYLISIHHEQQARGELIIAAGNAPDNPTVKMPIAALMEKAGDPADAAVIYKAVLQHGAPNLTALEGAGRTSFALGNYAQARDYLIKALNHPGGATESAQARQDLHDLLEESVQILLLYPSPVLSSRAQAERTLHDRNLVFQRLQECNVPLPGPSLPLPNSPSSNSPSSGPPSSNAKLSSPTPVDPALANVLGKWQQIPSWDQLTVPMLQKDEDLRQSVIQLVYETDRAAEKQCGPATGENALLSRIANSPGAVEAQ